MLNERQKGLIAYLKEQDRYVSVYEICRDTLLYEFNYSMKNHDKCIQLSNDIRKINHDLEANVIIIKKKNGNCKIANTAEEAVEYTTQYFKTIAPKLIRWNQLNKKIGLDGQMNLFTEEIIKLWNK